MPIGFALLIIFVLYLIDKHGKWKQAFQITVVLAAVAVIGLMAFYVYNNHHQKQQEANNQAIGAKKSNECASWEAEYTIHGSSAHSYRQCDTDMAVSMRELGKVPDSKMWPNVSDPALPIESNTPHNVDGCADALTIEYCSKQPYATCPEGKDWHNLALHKRAEEFCTNPFNIPLSSERKP
jgi:hypothetical protein